MAQVVNIVGHVATIDTPTEITRVLEEPNVVAAANAESVAYP